MWYPATTPKEQRRREVRCGDEGRHEGAGGGGGLQVFGGVRAVDQVSLTLDTGMSTVMIGPNGAGKTTLFNLIAGVYPLDEGRITLFGEDISKARHPAQERRWDW